MNSSIDLEQTDASKVRQTPTQKMGIDITPRRPLWTFHNVPLIWAGTVERTAFMAALSLVAPHFEPFACNVLREHIDKITEPELKKEARGFVGQESHHWKVHQRFNEQALKAQGWNIDELNTHYASAIDKIDRSYDDRMKLAMIAAGEHFLYFISTYILESDMLEDLAQMPQLMFEWHALEEVEHTSVAYDVFQHVYGASASSYFCRVRAMTKLISFLPSVLGQAYKKCLNQLESIVQEPGENGSLARSSKSGALGLCGSATLDVLRFYRPGFHPWNTHDKTHFLSRMPELVNTFDMAG